MDKLTRIDLLSLEIYAQQRGEFRARVMAHKKRGTSAEPAAQGLRHLNGDRRK